MRAFAPLALLALFSAPLSASDRSAALDDDRAMHGEQAVIAAWRSFFERTSPPFSSAPDNIVVIHSDVLAHNACAKKQKSASN